MIKGKKLIAVIILAVILFVVLINPTKYIGGRNIKIQNESGDLLDQKVEQSIGQEEETGDRSLLIGLVCENAKKRPMAVMMSGDFEARPLSGISEADIVVEMPVVTGGITRYMAIFGCDTPKEIGSIRSARHDYITLAAGFGAIYAHWGGSHFALDKLNARVIDNINALYLDGTVFYRKSGFVAPHDGFTTLERLEGYASQSGYSSDLNFSGYKFAEKEKSLIDKGRITISYPSIFKVEYEYSGEKGEYLRFKGGTRETDKNTGEQVSAKNVVVMYASSRQIEGQYNDMDIEGEGKATIFQNGNEISGIWKKDKSDIKSKLSFFDDAGKEIEFVPGKIWIQVVEKGQSVDWISSF
jgi:hypothetical protein